MTADAINKWTCKHCGFTNSIGSWECRGCEKVRGSTMTADAMLPCPFCGHTSVVYSAQFRRVRCNNCFMGSYLGPREQCVAAWNTRPTPQTPEDDVPSDEVRELPDDIRLPLHSLQADIKQNVGRILEDYQVTGMIVDSMLDRLSQIEMAAYRICNTHNIITSVDDPTDEMIAAGIAAIDDYYEGTKDAPFEGSVAACYKAMSTLAPNERTLRDIILDAYRGIMVLRTMCKKAGLSLAQDASDRLLKRMGEAMPELPGLSALRTHHNAISKIDGGKG